MSLQTKPHPQEVLTQLVLFVYSTQEDGRKTTDMTHTDYQFLSPST
jgi:hypothetical protein